MEETPAVQSETRHQAAAAEPRQARRRSLGNILGFVVGLVGIAALGATGWVYTETQREIVRMSTDIAQIRLSLALYGQQQPSAGTPAAAGSDQSLLDLSNRLAILEESWRSGTAVAAPSTLPALRGAVVSDAAPASGDDCLPTGTRFMVSAGDSYPVCGTTGKVEIGAVDNGFISLLDGTVIAQGGTIALPGTRCMIGVLPSEGGSVSGFAEIRVTC